MIEEPTTDESGNESHPAWVLLGASRVSSTPGAVLFDSDIRHQHYVKVTLRRATRKRDLHHDWKFGRQQLFEIAMSEAQWASFVSTMNVGDGVPATLEYDGTTEEREVPGMPYQPRLRESTAEVYTAAHRASRKVREAFATYAEAKTAANLRSLQAAIENMAPNVTFAAQSLTEHAENVVTKARADIEAFVTVKAQQLGLKPGDLGGAPQLDAGDSTIEKED